MDELTKVAAEEVTKTANGLLVRIFGPAADGLGIMLSQGIKLRILKNQVRGLKKVKDICEAENIELKQVNLKVLLPYLEGIAVEEEPELEEVWAKLMVNYLDATKNLESVVYPSVLKQLSTTDVNALKAVYDTGGAVQIIAGQLRQLVNRDNRKQYEMTYQMNNLLRLGFFDQLPSTAKTQPGLSMPMASILFKLSGFGKDFYEACQR